MKLLMDPLLVFPPHTLLHSRLVYGWWAILSGRSSTLAWRGARLRKPLGLLILTSITRLGLQRRAPHELSPPLHSPRYSEWTVSIAMSSRPSNPTLFTSLGLHTIVSTTLPLIYLSQKKFFAYRM
jgi:hypothetical protein